MPPPATPRNRYECAHPCDLCRGSELGAPCREAVRTYTDCLGFVYALCETHYLSLVSGLRRAVQNRTQRTTAVASRPMTGRRIRPGYDRRGARPTATAAEQRRAREAVGWSLRQLARELDRSYSQLQSAETGRRPVDPDVAAWVRGVLDGPPPGAEAQIREALADVLAARAEEEAKR